ncbi:MAG: hypothetical protein KUG77_04735 [Nannocystaceae bacterium]|nr:hypothetical protein [Nannocystaceae bacterium]
MLASEGFVSERKALQTRRRLAEKGFGDALDGDDLVLLARGSAGHSRPFDEDDAVLRGLEAVARNPSIYLRPIGEMSLASTYAKAIVEGALGPDSKDEQAASPSSWSRSPAALPSATARSMISVLLGRLERLDGANNGPLVDYALSFVGVRIAERLVDSFEKSPIDEQRMVLSTSTPGGRLWKTLYDWAGPSGHRRNALDRAVVDAWVTLDRVSSAQGPGPRAGPLMLAASVADKDDRHDEGRKALALDHETVAILSATWDERPLMNYGQTLTVNGTDDPDVDGTEVLVTWEGVLEYGAEHASFHGDGRYVWIEYQEPALPIPYSIFAPIDAVVLRTTGERFREGVEHLVAMLGAEDGIALRLLMALLQSPSTDARRQYAQYSVDALWRHVRSDPRYLAVWPRKFQHALEEYPSLRMLCEILHETRPALSQGAAQTLKDRLELWGALAPAVRDTLAGHASQLPGILRFQPGPDPKNHTAVEAVVQRSVGRLQDPGQHPAGSLASDVRFLLLTLARGTTVVELDQGTEDLGELLPRLWGKVLDFEAHRGLMVDYEEDLLRACGRVVLDLSFRTPRRTAADFLWLTYRLHAWLTEQIRLSDPEKREPGIRALVEATRRQGERPSLALDQMFNPFEFRRFGFEYRKAVLLSAFITGIEMARDEMGGKSDFFPFSLGLERRLLDIARVEPPASQDVPAESWFDWPLPLAVPDLAASILLQTNPGRVVTDDSSALLRRIEGWPSELSTLRSGERLFVLELSGTLGFGISQLDANLVGAYSGWIRALDPSDPQNQNARVIGVPALFGHGEDGLKDQARALAREELANDHAWTLLGHFFSGIAREGADLVVAEARAFLAYADEQDGEKRDQVRENIAVALARVATQATDQRSVVAIEAMRTLSEDAASSNWEQLRVLLAHVQGAGES